MRFLFLIFVCLCIVLHGYGQKQKVLREARAVISRFTEGREEKLKMELIPKEDGRDVFITEVRNGRLTLKGSSGVALCRGFYDFVKNNQGGIHSWSGKRYALKFPEQMKERRVVSPVQHHYYLNVVTYGYSMPYWDWDRWEQEIDWMALHGIDMPLALVANEAISARVWRKLGLSEEEIETYFVGAAHLPWMRMGNISGIDGPLTQEWHSDQITLQHRILARMQVLGMKPICPGFAGFVPQAFQRLYPGLKLIETAWCGGTFHNWMLSPEDPLFMKIGQMFIEEWEKEFGKNEYYIADSFNEMEIPFPPHNTPERYRLLSSYGDRVYRSIQAGNPDAVWVMQGWMFGYQRSIWDPKTLAALLEKVPDDKMLLLDLAVDYNECFWKNGENWEFYQGFFNKPWVYSVIPNMGGKTGLTGVLSFYANGHLKALHSSNKGRLAGIGMAPEGIENNEVIYELMSDAGWNDCEIDLDQWLQNYSACRYGAGPEIMKGLWEGLQKSVYGSFTDHPRYSWQFRPGLVQKGSVRTDSSFYRTIEQLEAVVPILKDEPLFRADLLEWVAAYVGGKLEILAKAITNCYMYGYTERVDILEKQFQELMLETDRILESHPVHRMQRWIDFARKHGKKELRQDANEHNARRIVTIWGPPVDDYSARIWSGLLRDYYWPRWKMYFDGLKEGRTVNMADWERDWVEKQTGLTVQLPYENVVDAALELLKRAEEVKEEWCNPGNEEIVGNWSPVDISSEWKEMEIHLPIEKLSILKGILFKYLRGTNQLFIREVSIVMDGKEVCRVKQDGRTGLQDFQNFYRIQLPSGATGNNSCLLKAVIKSDGNAESYGKISLVL